MPFWDQGFGSFRRVNFKVCACTLRTNILGFLWRVIIRFMAITIAFKGLLFLMDFRYLTTLTCLAIMDARARYATRLYSVLLLFRSISSVVHNLFVYFATINVDVFRSIAYRLGGRRLRAGAGSRYQGIVNANMFYDSGLTLYTTLSRSQTGRGAKRALWRFYRVITYRFFTIRRVYLCLVIVMYTNLYREFRGAFVNVLRVVFTSRDSIRGLHYFIAALRRQAPKNGLKHLTCLRIRLLRSSYVRLLYLRTRQGLMSEQCVRTLSGDVLVGITRVYCLLARFNIRVIFYARGRSIQLSSRALRLLSKVLNQFNLWFLYNYGVECVHRIRISNVLTRFPARLAGNFRVER